MVDLVELAEKYDLELDPESDLYQLRESMKTKEIMYTERRNVMSNEIKSFRGEFFFLSNFYEAPVRYDGIDYQNNEAAFQAQKCANPADRQKFAGLNPTEARHLGRAIPLRKDWEQVKISVMSEIVRAKFEQNPGLAEKLLSTHDAYLEEGNTWGERTWGTGNGAGANHFCRILMEVRSVLEQRGQRLQAMDTESI